MDFMVFLLVIKVLFDAGWRSFQIETILLYKKGVKIPEAELRELKLRLNASFFSPLPKQFTFRVTSPLFIDD